MKSVLKLSVAFILAIFTLNIAQAKLYHVSEVKALTYFTGGVTHFSLHSDLLQNAAGFPFSNPSAVPTGWNNGYCFNREEGRIILRLLDDLSTCPPDNFTCTVKVKVTYWERNSSTHVLTETVIPEVTLVVNYNKQTGIAYNEKNTYVLNNAHSIKTELLSTSNSSVSSLLFLESQLFHNRQTCDMDVTTKPQLTITYQNTTNEILATIGNNMDKHAEEYDLEWTVSDLNDLGNRAVCNATSIKNGRITYDFRNNSVRVTIPYTTSQYKITNLFNAETYVMFRVRAVGYYNGYRIEGAWSNLSNQPVGSNEDECGGTNFNINYGFFYQESSNHYIHIKTSGTSTEPLVHLPDMNWTYLASYAEEGKKNEVVSYFDGSLRNRQSVTRNNSDNTAIVKETIYDHQGRPAIDVLPVPVPEKKLAYQANFNLNTTASYNRGDFDLDGSSSACDLIAPETMSTSSGASEYYSTANSKITGTWTSAPFQNFNDYVPVANGFPFVQTVYMPDQTGRVRAKSAPGSNHYIGSGHETRYHYETPYQPELNRLFGNEVGYNVYYKKNTVIDANNQVSVSYLDMKGRVIATGLSAAAPTNTNALDNMATTSEELVDMLTPEYPSEVNNELIFTKTFTVHETGPYKFRYYMVPEKYTAILCPTQPCYDCVYDLNISLTDVCGAEQLSGDGGAVKKPIQRTIGGNLTQLNETCETVSEYHFGNDTYLGEEDVDQFISVSLAPGTYTLTKRLSINREAYKFYEAAFLANESCTTLTTFETQAWVEVQNNGCGEGSLTGMSICDAYKKLLENDLRPGGQYAQFTYDENGQMVLNTTILNVLNTAASGDDHYRSTSVFPNSVNVTINGEVMQVNQLTPEQFVLHWSDEWLPNLLPLHPEYCEYTTCTWDLSSQEYTMDIMEINTYDDAVDAGILVNMPSGNGYNIGSLKIIDPANDPLFSGNSTLLANMWASLIDVVTWTDANSYTIGVEAWDIAVMQLFCGELSNPTAGSLATCINDHRADVLTCGPYKDMYWRTLKAIYLTKKEQLYKTYKQQTCNPTITSPATRTIIPIEPAASGSASGASSQASTALSDSYNKQCEAYRDVWKSKLQKCFTSKGVSVGDQDLLLDQLEQVCVLGSDEHFPFGSSTVTPANYTSATKKSFADVFSTFNYQNGTAMLPIYEKGVCDAFILNMPMPYGHDYFAKSSPYADTCRCEETTPPEDCPCNSPTQQTTTGIKSLLKLTLDIVPDEDKCENCIDCAYFIEVYKSFYSLYPDFDETDYEDKELFRTFVNAKVGFNLDFSDYLLHASKCMGYHEMKVGVFAEITLKYITNQIVYPNLEVAANLGPYGYQYDALAFTPAPTQSKLLSGMEVLLASANGGVFATLNDITQKLQDNTLLITKALQDNNHTPQQQSANFAPLSGPLVSITPCICKALLDNPSNVSVILPTSIANEVFERCKNTFKVGYDYNHTHSSADPWKPEALDEFYAQMGEAPLKIECSAANTLCPGAGYNCDGGGGGGGGGSAGGSDPYAADYKCSTFMPIFKTFWENNSGDFSTTSLWIKDDLKQSTQQTLNLLAALVTQLNAAGAGLATPTSTNQSAVVDRIWELIEDCIKYECGLFTSAVNTFVAENESSLNPAYTLQEQIASNATLKQALKDELNTVFNRPEFLLFVTDEELAKLFKNCSLSPCLLVANEMSAFKTANPSYFNNTTYSYKELLLDPANASVLSSLLAQMNAYTLAPPYNTRITAENLFTFLEQCWTCSGSTFNFGEVESVLNSMLRTDPVQTGGYNPVNRLLLYTGWNVNKYDPGTYAPEFYTKALKRAVYPNSLKFHILSNRKSQRELKIKVDNGYDLPFNLTLYTSDANGNFAPPISDKFRYNRISSFTVTGIRNMNFNHIELLVSASWNYAGSIQTAQSMLVVVQAFPFYEKLIPNPSCNLKLNNRLCNRVLGEFELSEEDPCEKKLMILSKSNALNAYQMYREKLKNDFEQAYYAKCLMAGASEELQKKFNTRQYHYTLYYYDQAGNLVKTVPPSGVKLLNPSDQSTVDAKRISNDATIITPAHIKSTHYTYNTLNQLIWQKTPDAGVSEFWYDAVGRIVLSQNARQFAATPKKHSYTIYDGLGRINEVGELENYTLASNPHTYYRTKTNMDLEIGGSVSRKEVTRTLYDEQAMHQTEFTLKNVQSRVTHVLYYSTYDKLTPLAYEHGVHYTYDAHGNVNKLYREVSAIGIMGSYQTGQDLKEINYEYDLVSGKVNKVIYQPEDADQFMHTYSYDAENRLIKVESGTDEYNLEQDATYTYYAHGPLARNVIGAKNVQGVDYVYTVNGWLKGVNSVALDYRSDPGKDAYPGSTNPYANTPKDVFGFALEYYSGDYSPAYTGSTGVNYFQAALPSAGSFVANAPSLYNGNIRSMAVNIAQLSPILMAYKYDQLNRISGASYYNGFNAGSNVWPSSPSKLSAYANDFTYDPDGNILTQVRNGDASQTAMDNLEYHYNWIDANDHSKGMNNNRLTHVTDNVNTLNYHDDIDNQTSGNYTYDEIGNLIGDAREEIETIEWTVYGKIKKITRYATSNKPDLEFEYTPDGHRAVKIVIPKTAGKLKTYTYYVRDAQGNIMATYTRNSSRIIDYNGLTYADVNTRISNTYGTTSLSSFLASLHSTAPTINSGLNTAVYNKLTETNSNAENFLLQHDPVTMLNSEMGMYLDLIDAYDLEDFLTRLKDHGEFSNATIKKLCECLGFRHADNSSIPVLLHYLLSHSTQKDVFLDRMGIDHATTFANIATALGYEEYLWDPGTFSYIPNPQTRKDFILDAFGSDPTGVITAFENAGFNCGSDELFTIIKDYIDIVELFSSIDGIKNMLAKSTYSGLNCVQLGEGQVINALSATEGTTGLWAQLFASVNRGDMVNWFKQNDLFNYIYHASLLHPSTFSTYQQNNNMYSSSGNGMEAYFNHIRNIMGQTVYDNLINSYYNLSTTYIDSINVSEYHLYGSSRLGIYKTNLNLVNIKCEGIEEGGSPTEFSYIAAPVNYQQSFTYYTLVRGNKQYELSNHLGNVLAVVSDKVMPTCASGNVTGYTAELLHANDYSPFGAPLPGRTFNYQEVLNKTQIANNQFTTSTELNDWTATSGTKTHTNNTLQYSTTNATASVSRNYTTGTGKKYRLSLNIDLGTASRVDLSILGYNYAVLLNSSINQTGYQQIDFTSTSTTTTIKVEVNTGTGTRTFYLDNVKLEEIKGGVNGYRFGFNGKEDDEETWTQDYGFRIYNPRLGRFLSVDPLTKSYPMLTPYQFASNTPIQAIDLDGLESYIAIETKGTGHTFLVVQTADEIIVYTYGRFGAVDANQTTGEGVLQRLTGAEAIDYINTELTRMGAQFYKIGDVSPEKVKAIVDSKFIAGQASSEPGEEGKVIDGYNLFSSNCTTHSEDWLIDAGTNVFQESIFGVSYNEDFVIPSSLQDYLYMENTDATKQLSYANAEMWQLVKTQTPQSPLQGAGKAGDLSGKAGQSSGKIGNSSGLGSSTGRNTASSSSAGGAAIIGLGSSSSSSKNIKK